MRTLDRLGLSGHSGPEVKPARAKSLKTLAAALLVGGAIPLLAPRLWALDPGPARVTETAMILDADPGATITEVSGGAAGASFEPLGGRTVFAGGTSPVTWLRFRLAGGAEAAPGQWLLEIRPSFAIILEKVELFLPREGGGYAELSGGTRLPASAGEIASRYYDFAIPATALDGGYCYARLESSLAVEARIECLSVLAFAQRELLYAAAYGVIYGILAGMFLYNAFLFLSLKDRTHLFYILYILSGAFWQFWVQGHAKALVGAAGVELAAVWISVGGTLFWGGLYSMSFLSIRRDRPLLFWPLAAASGLGVAAALSGACGLDRLAFGLSHYGGIALPVLTIAFAAVRLRQRYEPAAYYLVGWAFLVAGSLAFALMGLGLLGVSFWTVNGVALGMAAQSVLLSMALGERMRRLKRETDRLQRSQARYLELSLTDGLTGLYNKRYFSSKLASEAEHAERIERPLSLLFLDLDDFKRVNDEGGHPLGDAVLKDLAAAMGETVREGDIACRYGGEEFVVIMPGTGREEAAAAAERLRGLVAERPLPRDARLSVPVTISVGVAELRPGEGAEALVERADAAMYEAKRRGKNRVELAISSDPLP
jgi:diguanylate cyclase (GGDEF)-like protein